VDAAKTHAFGNESTIYLRGLGEAEIGTIQKGKVDTVNTKGEQTIYFFEVFIVINSAFSVTFDIVCIHPCLSTPRLKYIASIHPIPLVKLWYLIVGIIASIYAFYRVHLA
jgi:hypothetical protein